MPVQRSWVSDQEFAVAPSPGVWTKDPARRIVANRGTLLRHPTTVGDALAPQMIGNDGMVGKRYGQTLDEDHAAKQERPVGDMKRLPRLVAETPVDKTVPVTVWRKHGETSVQVKIGRLEESEQQQASTQEPPKTGDKDQAGVIKTLGLTLSSITPELKEKYSLANDSKGVVVVDVAKDSAAAAKGVHPGDMIMEAAQQEVSSPGEISSRIDEAKKSGRKSILLLVERQGDLRFVALRLDQG